MKGSKTAEVGRSSGDRRGKKVRTYYSVGTGPVFCSEQEAREKGGEGPLVSVRAKNKVEARRALVRIQE